MRSACLSALAALFALTACEPREVCGGELDACGGDLSGTWSVLVDTCEDQTYLPYTELTFYDQPVDFAREDPPERTGADWCADLRYMPSGIQSINLNLLEPWIPVTSATITYTPEEGSTTRGTYEGSLSVSGQFTQYFSRACLTAHGANPTCDELTAALNDRLENSSGFGSFSCTDGDDFGCDCSYDRFSVPALLGSWSTRNGVVTHFDSFGKLPSQADYCANGDTLQLSGHNRQFLWDHTGLRELVLGR